MARDSDWIRAGKSDVTICMSGLKCGTLAVAPDNLQHPTLAGQHHRRLNAMLLLVRQNEVTQPVVVRRVLVQVEDRFLRFLGLESVRHGERTGNLQKLTTRKVVH